MSQEQIKYLFLDGVNFDVLVGDSVERTPVLVAIGVTEAGRRLVLGLQAGDKESSSSWREFFKDLKRRGLDSAKVTMGIMDGLPGLEKVFVEEFPKAKVQRCQVHVARNVLAKVPQKFKETVADGMGCAPSSMPLPGKRRASFSLNSRQNGKRSSPLL